MNLRPYQSEARNAVETDWETGYLRTLLVLPTGCGKTIVFCKIIEDQVRLGRRALILAHRGELLEQAADKLAKATGLGCAVEKAEESSIGSWFRVVVGSVQSMTRETRLSRFKADHFDVIVVDEAHHCLSESYQRVLSHFGGARVLGVTATPDRGDMKNLGQYFEHLAYEYTLPRAIRDGYLCPIKAVTIPLKLDLSGVGVQAGDFKSTDIDTALDPYLFQIAQEMKTYCMDRKTVVFLPLVKTSQKFRDILNAQGFRAAEVNGGSEERSAILRDFSDGKYNVLCNSMLLTEGWDCPPVDCIVILRPTKVRSLYSQMVGRGTRLSPETGKDHLLLLDFLWHTERHELCHPASLICENEKVARKMTELIQAAGCPVDMEAAEKQASEDVVAQREEALAKQLSEMRSRKRKDEDWQPTQEIVKYLETLFKPDDLVCCVTQAFKDTSGKIVPGRGDSSRTAAKLMEDLEHYDGDIGAVFGDSDPDIGAWILFNPIDGQGRKDRNVTEFRYALVESDTADLETQYALIRQLELPVACLVYSGGKSLHAIVHIDAGSDPSEYKRRVRYLYDMCEKNGLVVDKQDKNAARLSRMPGVLRGGHKQYLIATNIGKANWAEWVKWTEENSDELPDPENMADAWDNLPELAQPLIDGVLRQGHKMLLAGPSKAGKSYALIELCCAIAEGRSWLGFQCTQGRVLYVNLELDRASCLHRFRDVYEKAGWQSGNLKNIDVWNLRGKSVPMDKLAPKLIRRARKKDYLAIVIDPIYKVITGDENSADQMARFCNYFDTVCTELNCAVIYCHHHSKGIQGGKRSMDRASGSGVFARDPDALLDLIELPVNESLRKQELNNAVRRACSSALKAVGKLDEVSQDDLCSENAALTACKGVLDASGYQSLLEAVDAAKGAAEARSAWRIEGTLREFPKFPPVNLWFDYPIHLNDESGVLADINPESDKPSWQKAAEKHKKSAKERQRSQKQKFEDAIANANMGEPPTVADLVEWFSSDGTDIPKRTIYSWIKKYGYEVEKNTGKVVKRQSGEAEEPNGE